MKIIGVDVSDVRFPTSVGAHGSDAMNKDGDHSAAYVVLRTDGADPESGSVLAGHGLTFTIGRGNEIVALAARQVAEVLVGRDVDALGADMAATYRLLTADSQMRWLGPEKGVVHLALAAVLNAIWDLVARRAGLPLWRLLANLTPEELAGLADLRYVTDVLTRDEAVALLCSRAATKSQRIELLAEQGYPVYTTSAGWLGYDDALLRQRCRQAAADGYRHVKLKVGGDLGDDIRRCAIAREELGPACRLMIDANQVWDVDEAIVWVRALAEFDPLWIEEPTSPDDILGHATIRRAVAPIGVATGEHCHNRVMFKQLLQAEALDYCQVDTGRLASVNEILTVLLMAAKFGVPVCPHAGGVGLCEMVQHISVLDFVAVSGELEGRVTEYVDHLHEHFTDPCLVADRGAGAGYVLPTAPGYSTRMHASSVAEFSYPDGAYWRAAIADAATARS